ncbi:MAG: hypothetical protein M3R09_04665 [Actinomycetota bacterium]|nr:hypothetical protein [Actinomycetota bacterium]
MSEGAALFAAIPADAAAVGDLARLRVTRRRSRRGARDLAAEHGHAEVAALLG